MTAGNQSPPAADSTPAVPVKQIMAEWPPGQHPRLTSPGTIATLILLTGMGLMWTSPVAMGPHVSPRWPSPSHTHFQVLPMCRIQGSSCVSHKTALHGRRLGHQNGRPPDQTSLVEMPHV